jgi:transcriptional regulator with XRE-family HTH domain
MREMAGLRPAILAERIGVSRTTLLQWENRRCEPSLAMIEKLAEALGITPEFLAFGPGTWSGSSVCMELGHIARQGAF